MHQQACVRSFGPPLKSSVRQCDPVTACVSSRPSFVFHCCLYQHNLFRKWNPIAVFTNRIIQVLPDLLDLLRFFRCPFTHFTNGQADEVFSFAFRIFKSGSDVKRTPISRIRIFGRYQAFCFSGRSQPKIDCICPGCRFLRYVSLGKHGLSFLHKQGS